MTEEEEELMFTQKLRKLEWENRHLKDCLHVSEDSNTLLRQRLTDMYRRYVDLNAKYGMLLHTREPDLIHTAY